MAKTNKKKQAQRARNRAVADYTGKPKTAPDTSKSLDPIELAHRQLDDWIAGRITAPFSGPFDSDVPGGSGIIWLGNLKDTMLRAQEFYQSKNPDMVVTENGHIGIAHSDARTGSIAADTPRRQNERGEWVPAIPLPHYGLKKRCSCGASFWREKNYRAHYALHHVLTGLYPL